MTSDKAVDLVGKLARVAAPNSGASDNERVTAALQVCELIAEHGLTVRVAEKQKQRFEQQAHRRPSYEWVKDLVVRAVRAEQARRNEPTDYIPAEAAYDATCGEESCHGEIYRGEKCWRRTKNGEVEYVHANCWTD